MLQPKTVDDYIANAPADLQSRLRDLRDLIKQLAPNAEEKISYGMPYYSDHGRLVYFAYTKTHIGLYALFPDEQTLQHELKDYSTSKGTIRFPLDKPLPMPLIKKLLQARIKQNEASSK